MTKPLVYARNIAVAIVSIALLLVAIGTVYTWWMGRNSPPKQFVTQPVSTAKPAVVKPKADLNATIGVSTQSITSPVVPGDNASISVRSGIESMCAIKVEYNKVPAKDSGLVKHPTDEYGIAEWTWTVDPNAPLGTWPVEVTCQRGERSAVVRADLVVKSKAELNE